MGRINGLLVWVPEVMSDELQNEFRISGPREWAPGRGPAPSLEIRKVGGEGAEGIGAHPGIGEMLQGGDIGIRQDLGIAIG
jgi:hypothetical protein